MVVAEGVLGEAEGELQIPLLFVIPSVGWACGPPMRMKIFRFSNPFPRTHHPFLFVIPSVAEGSAVRPSPSRKHRVAALPLLRLSPLSPPCHPHSTERSGGTCGSADLSWKRGILCSNGIVICVDRRRPEFSNAERLRPGNSGIARCGIPQHSTETSKTSTDPSWPPISYHPHQEPSSNHQYS
jgi:hypothetical protein